MNRGLELISTLRSLGRKHLFTLFCMDLELTHFNARSKCLNPLWNQSDLDELYHALQQTSQETLQLLSQHAVPNDVSLYSRSTECSCPVQRTYQQFMVLSCQGF